MRRLKTLYVSDLDGTLLDNNSLISSKTAEMINELCDRGALITVATARTPATVDRLLQHTHISAPAIVMTGAATWDCDIRQYCTQTMMSDTVAQRVYDTFVGGGVDPFVYSFAPNGVMLDVYHGEVMNRQETNFYQERRHLSLKKFHIGQRLTSFDRTVLQFAIGPYDRIKSVADKLMVMSDCSVSFYPDIIDHDIALIEVFAHGVSKARAVKKMAEDCGAERIVVFGDNLNDLPMMKMADVAVAVANALEEVRDAADIVIGPNSDNSVARFICEDSGL